MCGPRLGEDSAQVDPRLVEAWLGARSLARGLPQPVRDGHALRVDTDLPDERLRYVFASAAPSLTALAARVSDTLTIIKLAGPPEVLAALAGPRWRVSPPTHMMTADPRALSPVAALAPGFRMEIATEGAVTVVRILAADGLVAASGHAAEQAGAFAYDRIVTQPGYLRLGLGSAVMAALASARRSLASQPVLVATDDGRALYTRLGWRVISPWSTAMLVQP